MRRPRTVRAITTASVALSPFSLLRRFPFLLVYHIHLVDPFVLPRTLSLEPSAFRALLSISVLHPPYSF
ncbi:hypothetical protein GQ602_003970 [Ophiocordyceps camponoti-floridani]|uniref:Uncharacterized protein n=1 Tax=Ophiocordyceps camponoti-floridani TaxID=2030778 RepID=A0A8H4Q5Y5_9HYPO|nr:hypothetical protein GQ602_003970 [Ophiocordyceps camponoti-floridani]